MGRVWPPLALLLIALVALGTLQPLAPHTDDGCRTEIHCQACRHGLASLAVVGDLGSAGPHLRVAAAAAPGAESTRELLAAAAQLLRGPPPSA